MFDLPADVIYLNAASAGPRLHAVNAAAQQGLKNSARPWRQSTREWLEESERLRALAAAVLATHADALAFIPSVSYGMAIAAKNLPLRRGQNVVVLAGEYPSNHLMWARRAEECGANLVRARRQAGEEWTSAVLRNVNERTAIVCVPHCYWTDGSLLDLDTIAVKARGVSAALVIDASQSLGALPLDLEALAPDFVISAGHKWLLGPYGFGWLWAAPRWRTEGEPIEQTMLAREGWEDFSAASDSPAAYRSGARRFDSGECLGPLSVPMAIASMTQLRNWGVEAISQQLGELTHHLEQRLRERALNKFLVPGYAPHLCSWKPPEDALPTITNALAQAGVIVSVRNGGLRIAPHLHIDFSHLDVLVDVLASALG